MMKGVLIGAAMMVGAAVWFFVALAADRIYIYPPILFVLGGVTLIKALMTKPPSGEPQA